MLEFGCWLEVRAARARSCPGLGISRWVRASRTHRFVVVTKLGYALAWVTNFVFR